MSGTETTLPSGALEDSLAKGKAESTKSSAATEASKSASDDAHLGSGIMLRRAELVHGAKPVEIVKENKGLKKAFLEDRPKEEVGDEIEVNPETVADYKKFLKEYVTDMNKMAGEDSPDPKYANLLECVLNNPDREADQLVMQLLSTRTYDAHDKELPRTVNEAAITEFLGKHLENNWAAATMLMEQHALMNIMADGISASVDPVWYNKQPSGGFKDTDMILSQDLTARSVGKFAYSKVVSGMGAAGYALLGRGKEILKLESDVDLMEEILKNTTPEQKAYFKAMTTLDLNRIRIVPTVAGKAIAHEPSYPINHEHIKESITGDYKVRADFLKQLGIDERPSTVFGHSFDRTRSVRTPDIDIFEKNDKGRPEGLAVRYLMDVNSEFLKDPDRSTVHEREMAMYKAREKVMVKYLKETKRVNDAAETNTRESQGRKDKIAERTDVVKRAEIITKRKEKTKIEKATAERAHIEAQKLQTEHVTPLQVASRAVIDLESSIGREHSGIMVSADIVGSLEARIGTIDTNDLINANTELNRLEDLQGECYDKARESAEKATANAKGVSSSGMSADGNVTISVDINPFITAGEKSAARYDSRIREVNAKIAELKAEKAKLEASISIYNKALDVRESSAHALAARLPGELNASAKGLAEIKALTDTAGNPVFPNDDEIRTLPVEELIKKIDVSGKVFSDQEKIDFIKYAKAELVGQAHEASRALLPDQKNALADITAANINLQDILTMTPAEIQAALKDGVSRGGANRDWADADMMRYSLAIKSLISTRLAVRSETRGTIETDFWEKKSRGESSDGKSEDQVIVGAIDKEVEQLQVVDKILKADEKSKIYGRAADITKGPQEIRDALTNAATISATDTAHIEAERNKGVSEGYVAWVKMLYPEYEGAANADKIFDAIHALLPPDQLASILKDKLSLVTPSADFNAVITEIKTKFTGPTPLRQDQFVDAFREITLHLKRKGLSL